MLLLLCYIKAVPHQTDPILFWPSIRLVPIRMIFALDATPLTVPTGGIRRYTESLARALAENFPLDQFHLISDQPFVFSAAGLANLHVQSVPGNRWWSFRLSRTLKQIHAGVFHGTDFAVPYVPARPSVLTLHDLSPWRPHAAATRVRTRTPILLRAGIATMVITPSEAIRREAIQHFGLNPGRIVAIPLAAPETFQPVSVPPPSPYFLFVGTLEPRKNISRMIEAWREVRRRQPVELWIAGRLPQSAAAPDPEPGLRLLGAVSDGELPPLYSAASAFLYPSLYEGFGLPVLEAMQCGVLVIASRDPAIMEVTGGEAAIHVDSDDVRALASAMESALVRNQTEVRDRALIRAQSFNWNATARLTREVYGEAIRVFSRS